MTAALALVQAGPAEDELAAVLYGRQSHAEDASIRDQLTIGARRAETEAWAVLGIFSDGRSASRHARGARGDWDDLIALVAAGKVGIIWLWESSRGDRKASTWLALLEVCQETGTLIYIETHRRAYDMNVTRDWRTMAEDGVDNQVEAEKIAERTNRAKDTAREEGRLRTVLGGLPPLGYRMTAEDVARRAAGRKAIEDWETDEDAAGILREIAGRMLADPERRLTPAYRAAPAGFRAEWSEKQVRAALTRPATAGIMTARDGTELGQVIADPPLDLATFRTLAAVFASRRRGRIADGDRYPLGVLLRCGKCGNQLNGGPGWKGRPYYSCANPHPALGIAAPCRGVSISAAQLHEVVRVAAEEWAATSKRFAAAAAAGADVSGRLGDLARSLGERQEWMADLLRKRTRGMIDPAGFAAAEAELTANMEAIIAERDALAAEAAEPAVPVALDWDEMTGAQKRRLVADAFVTPIVVAPGTGGARPLTAEDRVALTVRPAA
jgi:DNA invertase Pin-like site-specific DNA recombinase